MVTRNHILIRHSILILLVVLTLSACNNHQGFEKAPNGLLYKFHIQNPENQKVGKYDVVQVKMNYRTRDSVLYNGGNETIPFQIDPLYDGDLMEGIMMMHLNDSATFILNTADFFLKMMNYEIIPEHAQGSEELFFDIKLVEIRPETKALKQRRLMLEKRKREEPNKIIAYLEKENLTQKPNSSGLYVLSLHEGTGPVAILNSMVKVHYTGKLLDGSVFESSRKRGSPINFTVGAGEVLAAWDAAIPGMKQGAKARLIVPSALAYGDKSRNGLEPYTPLIFDIEIVEVK